MIRRNIQARSGYRDAVSNLQLTVGECHMGCLEIKSEQLRLALLGSNLANTTTTRTPEGGAYRPYSIVLCLHGLCSAHREKAPVMKYLPAHPDADKNGMVAFPNINGAADYRTFNMTAAKLKMMAASGSCHAKVVADNGASSYMLEYGVSGSLAAKDDAFNLDGHGAVVSWMRQQPNGVATTTNFSTEGVGSSF